LSGSTVNLSHLILRAIEGFDRVRTIDELKREIAAIAATFGFDAFCYAGPKNTVGSQFAESVLLDGWPTAWFEHYRTADFWGEDPVALFARARTASFLWSEAPLVRRRSKLIMDVAAVDYRLRYGLCVPIHGLAGYQASISFAGYDIDSQPEARAAMELIAVYAANKANQLATRAVSVERILTAREREIMSWVAAGKTAWDIGAILHISEDTVNKLVASAMRRLNTYNRPQAVAESIRRGEISL